jgi:UDP-N-acetyl-alpha-D-muramoyl-L-alanyl-L-glutamate epimerase
MAADATRSPAVFDPAGFETFRFLGREMDPCGRVTLRYALDEEICFVEQLELPVESELSDGQLRRAEGLLSLLHWVAGVSYFKTAAPATIGFQDDPPPPAAADLLEALYSQGLGEFAYANRLPALPRPRIPRRPAPCSAAAAQAPELRRLLVPVGGGKDSAVALEIARRSGREVALFSIGDPPAITRTVKVAGLDHLLARRRLDPQLATLNGLGALNGHIPITAIVSCVALLTAELRGFDAVVMANERSASSGNVVWDGVEINHQFSKGLAAERLLRAALAEAVDGLELFSILRPASELSIARAFARMEQYHPAFTSCNATFRMDPQRRAASWCCECPKCRFVFLVLAPFSEPAHLRGVFGRDLLEDEDQFEGFALLTATGGHKPFECVGEEEESLAAMRLLAVDPRWRSHAVVRRLAAEVLPRFPQSAGDPVRVLAMAEDHHVPVALMPDVRAVLGA